MLPKLLLAFSLMAVSVTVHAIALAAAFRYVERQESTGVTRFWNAAWLLTRVAGWSILSHLLQIFTWGSVYAAAGAIRDLASAFYFSAVTYTTTGYGDLVLPQQWRVVGGIEALTGILMCGLSTGLFFGVFARVAGIIAPTAPAQ
ncbi:MAG TPA: ion channel [Chthoniobacterales bacterium]|jgi:hypothetical protein|nr:ion channel [Chthoniobacterales bacterium]